MNNVGSPPVDQGRSLPDAKKGKATLSRTPTATAKIAVLVSLGIACLAVQARTTWAQALRQPNQWTNHNESDSLQSAGMVFPVGQSPMESLQQRSEPGYGLGYFEDLDTWDSVESDGCIRLARHLVSMAPDGPAPMPPQPAEPGAGNQLSIDLPNDDSPSLAETDDPLCATEVDHRPIGSLSTNILCTEGALPPDCAQGKFPQMGEAWDDAAPIRNWTGVVYPWEASYLCHRPLYFEEINLERYGYMNCDHRCKGIPAAILQPVLSGAHFFATVPILPYKMVVEPPCKCIYTLGHYRPGSPVPYRINRMPLRPTAGVVEAAVIAGMVIAFP
ncbi:hypothetical protein ACFL5Q_05995 [Planctomycetota bacterium]